jgi:hypothetical protein
MARQRYSQRRVADAIRSTRGLVSLAARQLGCDRSTVENYCDRYPTVRQALHDAREQRLDIAEAMLHSAVDRGELPAIMFYLKTVGKGRGYGDVVQVDATVDLLSHPDWVRTRTMLLEVLRGYPDAMAAVVAGLRALTAPSDDGGNGHVDVTGGAG